MTPTRLSSILLDVLRVDGTLVDNDLVDLVEPAFPPTMPYAKLRALVAQAVRELAARGLVERRGHVLALRA